MSVVLAVLAVLGTFCGYNQYILSKKHVEGIPTAESVYEVNFHIGPYGGDVTDKEAISKIVDALNTAKATNKKVYHSANALDVIIRFYDENGEYDCFSYALLDDNGTYYIDLDYYPLYNLNSDDTLWRVDKEFADLVYSIAAESEQ